MHRASGCVFKVSFKRVCGETSLRLGKKEDEKVDETGKGQGLVATATEDTGRSPLTVCTVGDGEVNAPCWEEGWREGGKEVGSEEEGVDKREGKRRWRRTIGY